MKIALGISTVPERQHLLPALLARLTPATATPFTDHDHNGCGWNRARALHTLAAQHPDTDYLIVLDDDVSPCVDFAAQAAAALAAVPFGKPVNFFSARTPPAGTQHWYKDAYALGGQCFAMPTPLAEPFVAFAMKYPKYPHDDVLMAAFFRRIGSMTYVSQPSLVQHLDVPSSVGHAGGKHYRAKNYLADPRGTDWTLGAYDPPTLHTSIPRKSLNHLEQWRRP